MMMDDADVDTVVLRHRVIVCHQVKRLPNHPKETDLQTALHILRKLFEMHCSKSFLVALLLSVVLQIAAVDGFAFKPLSHTYRSTTADSGTSNRLVLYASKPFAVVVQAEIVSERMDEFLELIETNAQESRKEPGCQRFDVLRLQDNGCKFIFYEVYDGPEAIDHHKSQPHYNLWADFKESGGVVDSVSYKADGEFMTE